jgi:hypothetical protein
MERGHPRVSLDLVKVAEPNGALKTIEEEFRSLLGVERPDEET